jgi:hypothetical protein
VKKHTRQLLVAILASGTFTGLCAAEEPEKQKPLSFSIDYTLVTDYVWRGQNLSEYAGEGREDLNHQMTAGVAYDTGSFGTFAASVWFEWFAGQDALTPGSGCSLQEIDYTISWSYDIEPIATTVEVGWIGYHFPRASGDAAFTNELYVSLSLDDSKLFGTEEPVVSPYVAYYHDVDDVGGGWLEWGISHAFAADDLGMGDIPVLKHLTLTPSFAMGIDHGQLSSDTRIAHLQYGVEIAFDLGTALGMPPEYGMLTLTGFLRFSDAVFEAALNDEFWGGMTIGYSW